MRFFSSLFVCVLFALSTVRGDDDIKPVPRLLIKAAHFVDPVTGGVKNDQAILIEGEKVKAVGSAADLTPTLPSGTRVIDLGQATVLPGLIDCHVHLSSNPGNYYEGILRRSSLDVATIMHLYARRTLLAGFTTVRNVGAPDYLDFSLRRRDQRRRRWRVRACCAAAYR